MYTINRQPMRIEIDLSPGVYRLAVGLGKTYLTKLLEQYRAQGCRCAGYTYGDARKIEDVLDPSRYDLVILDRYDMYYGEGAAAIQEFGKTGIVLVVCIQPLRLPGSGGCVLLQRQGEILVWCTSPTG